MDWTRFGMSERKKLHIIRCDGDAEFQRWDSTTTVAGGSSFPHLEGLPTVWPVLVAQLEGCSALALFVGVPYLQGKPVVF